MKHVSALWFAVWLFLLVPIAASATPGDASLSFDFDGNVTSYATIPDSTVLLFVHLGEISPPKEITFRIYWAATSPGRVNIGLFGGPLSYGVGWFTYEGSDTLTNAACGRVKGIREAIDGEVHFFIPLRLKEFGLSDGVAFSVGYLQATDSTGIVQQFAVGNTVTLGSPALIPPPLSLHSVSPLSIAAGGSAVSFDLRGSGLQQLQSASLLSGTSEHPLAVAPRSVDGSAVSLIGSLSALEEGTYGLRLDTRRCPDSCGKRKWRRLQVLAKHRSIRTTGGLRHGAAYHEVGAVADHGV